MLFSSDENVFTGLSTVHHLARLLGTITLDVLLKADQVTVYVNLIHTTGVV